MCREESVNKNGEVIDNSENPNVNEKLSEPNNKSKTTGNGWRDILDELDCPSGPGDNIYVFG